MDNKIYVELFHGRDDPAEDMEDWGFQGPVLGPFKAVHMTYFSMIRLQHGEDWVLLPIKDDMIEYRGKFYGDWCIYPGEVSDLRKGYLEDINETLSILEPL